MKSEKKSKKKRRMMNHKGKGKVEEETDTDLILKINRAFEFNNKSFLDPYYGSNLYTVVAYTDPEDEYEIKPAVKVYQGEKLIFNTILEIPVEWPARHVYIELLRKRKKALSSDPQTSTAIVVMGRAKIKLPFSSCGRTISRNISLLGLNNDGRCIEEKGTLNITMKLRSFTHVKDEDSERS